MKNSEVSARVTGFTPWDYIVQYNRESKMEGKIYRDSKDAEDNVCLPVTKELPDLPAEYEKTAYKANGFSVYAQWEAKTAEIQYVRADIAEDFASYHDAEYDTQEKVEVAGYEAYYYVKGEEAWVIWNDLEYEHSIYATGDACEKEFLLEMAESLYQE